MGHVWFAKERMLFVLKPGLNGFKGMRVGLKAEGFRLHAGSLGMQGGSYLLEGMSRRLKPGEHSLEPGEVGLKGEEQLLKGEELFFEQPQPGLEETRHFLQPTGLGAVGPPMFDLETAVGDEIARPLQPTRTFHPCCRPRAP